MNAVAVIEAAVTPLNAWVNEGRAIAGRITAATWELGDWANRGEQEGWCDQGKFELLGGELGLSPKRIREVHRASKAFPPHLRDSALTVEHHIQVADLPRDEQFELLGMAKDQHWNADDLRKQTITRKVETGRAAMLSQEEWDDLSRMQFLHVWNRASVAAREDIAELVSQSHMRCIDA
ncbi:hypothetical protein N6H05_14775 [Sphingobium sp. WTD-1]|uniref:hypothetical protein n=1 Tax=Sphingobium sp. WTD-1 TaxID=2979467 RepID=UPI0024DEF7D1|nr:hypothetical protein [Sphingobium sp. WTD-1]WIA54328.1 hypothetical protein N6H05_14775 [Sphingobium sp. WTD-1]